MTVIELEFDASAAHRPLGDIASSLVSIDELLRDLATIAAYPSSPEFREIQVAQITTGKSLKVTLSLIAIPEEAVTAFQEVCRGIIVREKGRAAIDAALARCLGAAEDTRMTEPEAQRVYGHIATLQRAEIPLKKVVVKEQ